MYETYTRYIYQWLTENDIADKLSTITSNVETICKALLFFGLCYLGFKLLKKEWLNV